MTHLPTGYNSSIDYPIILAFHGGQANNASIGWSAIAYQSRLNQKSDSAGFIVVYPEGSVFNNNRTWNAGNCCPPAMNQNVDDVGFIDNLLDTLFLNYSIDTARVYATGSSNGGMMCYRLACELSERFAAIAPNASTQMYFPCNPTRNVPIIHFQSYVDTEVPYNGGFGTGPSGAFMISQDSTMHLWHTINNCSTVDTIVNGNGSNYDFITIYNCDCGVEFHQYNTTDGGHSWPGGNPNNNPVSTQLSATYLLWEFFQNYTLGCVTTGIHINGYDNNLFIYPNPATNTINIDNLKAKTSFVVFNTFGQIVLTGTTEKTIDINSLTKGIYYLRLENGNSFKAVKLIKE